MPRLTLASDGGYTIIEVMIFLAISAVMFASAMIAIGGRQRQVQFGQAVRELNGRLNDLANDVSAGFSPNGGTFSCTTTSPGRPQFSAADTEQGQNSGCVFIGKAVQFGLGSNDDAINVYTLVGRRQVAVPGSGNREAISYEETVPTVTRSASGDLTKREPLKWGLRVRSITNPSNGRTYGSLVFLGSLSSYQVNGEGLNSGKQDVVVAGVESTNLNQDENAGVNAINAVTDRDGSANEVIINPTSGLRICVADPYGRAATITVKPGAIPLSDLQIDGGPCT